MILCDPYSNLNMDKTFNLTTYWVMKLYDTNSKNFLNSGSYQFESDYAEMHIAQQAER